MRRFLLTQHAQDAVQERAISDEWLQRVISLPEQTEPDRDDPEVEHLYGRIQEYGNRVLHVVIIKGSDPVRIVTAYFDRTVK